MNVRHSTIFSFLFALAAFAYHAQIGLSWILVFAALVLVKPSSSWRFLLFVLLQTLLIFSELPFVNTNRTLTFFVGLSILLPAIPILISTRGRPQGPAVVAAAEPLLRIELLIVYVLSFWHKLNEDFLDPRLSCASAIYAQLKDAVSWIPLPAREDAAGVMIVATLVIEGLLPVLLAVRATRKWGVAVGVMFHFVLGLVWFYSFSATMIALLFLFVPEGFPGEAQRFWETHRRRILLGLKIAVPSAALVVAGYALARWDFSLPWSEALKEAKPWIKQLTWLGWLSLVVPIALFLNLLRNVPPDAPRPYFRIRPAYLLIPLLMIANGLSPYLGLKTETSFAMYSNLRTEGGRSNHLVFRAPLALADYQTDLVEIVDSSDERLALIAERQEPIPFVVLRRWVLEASAAGARGISVTYVRGGVERSVRAAETDPELTEPLNYLERKLLVFRRILTHTDNICLH